MKLYSIKVQLANKISTISSSYKYDKISINEIIEEKNKNYFILFDERIKFGWHYHLVQFKTGDM